MGRRRIIVGLCTAAVLVSSTGAAFAGISDGNYRPERQGCTGNADDSENPSSTESGCQNLTVNVRDGNDHDVVRAGTPQVADGESPAFDKATVTPTPDGFDPSTGTRVYMGADDNLDNGEHDGSKDIQDGPSDGGAIVFNIEPGSVQAWTDALTTGDLQYLLTHPLPLVDAGFGSCADGVCESVQTQRRTAYHGGNPDAPARDVADYEGHQWDPDSCSSADPTTKTCDTDPNGTKDLTYWHDQNGDAYVEPGAQVYEDPSPASSPIGPYPLTAVYAGSCGVIVGGGPTLQVPASPLTNSAGQAVVKTGC